MINIILSFRHIGYSFYSVIINVLYIIRYIRRLPNTIVTMSSLRFDTIVDVELFIGGFTWTADRFRDWQPWAVTMFIRKLHDDCDGAAVLGKWCLEELGINSKIVYLWNTKDWGNGHAICFAQDYRPGRHLMITNNQLLYINGDNWKQAIHDYFSGEYDIMQTGFKIEKLNS